MLTLNQPKDYVRAWKYGMTIAQLRDFFAEHNFSCDICGVPGDATKRGMGLVIDHDHDCCPQASPREIAAGARPTQMCGKCNRGLLCVACNAGIGQLQHDPEILQAAILYLKKED